MLLFLAADKELNPTRPYYVKVWALVGPSHTFSEGKRVETNVICDWVVGDGVILKFEAF